MNITRRCILQTAAAFGIVGTRSWAVTEAGFDDFTIHSVSDGKLVLPMDFLVPEGVDLAPLRPILDAAGLGDGSFDSPINVTLMKRGDDMVLFDAGSGPDFMPTAGELVDALQAIDVSPDQITHVVFTHAHPDHIWGVLDDFDEPVFTNARHMIGQVERDYWMAPDTVDTIDPARQSFAVGAQRRIEALGDALELFADGDEVLPGIRAQMTPGHTPGHTSFDIDGRVFVVGDAIANAHLAFKRPELPSGSDQDQALGAETRVSLLKQLAESDTTIVGYHLPDGGIGKVAAEGDAYTFVKT